ncbi:MAG: hypothetical protein K6V97_04710 [Actinomycetia bacterium]|nr:hypothetical protein [Actinomycetes bacterium]
MGQVIVRLDVEDWLTPAADWALEAIVGLLETYGIRANTAVVGRRAASLVGRGRGDLLRRLAARGTVGYHSFSHSEHPTLAEDLERFGPDEAVARFVARERPGLDILRRAGLEPRFFTQPGGNWVPEAAVAGPALGLAAYFSEAWNAYLVPAREPLWLGSVLHLAPPVDMPKGFLFGLPEGVEPALEAVWAAWRRGTWAVLVTHPTELVTTRFWDADNFGGGRTAYPRVPAPTRPAAAWEQARAGLERYLAALTHAGAEWVTVADLLEAAAPPAPTWVDRATLAESLGRHGFGPMRVPGGSLSAAEAVWALAAWAEGGRDPLAVPAVGPPDPRRNEPGDLARGILRSVADGGTLPGRVGGLGLAEAAGVLARRMGLGSVPVTCTAWVRRPAALHWDWPIFPPGFAAWRLWTEARRLSWTLKPVVWRRPLWVAAEQQGGAEP